MSINKKNENSSNFRASDKHEEVLKAMLEEGVNVFRINFSHADYTDVAERIKMIRELNDEFGYNAAILADLQGPKLRVGIMKEEVVVNEGDEIIICYRRTILKALKSVFI